MFQTARKGCNRFVSIGLTLLALAWLTPAATVLAQNKAEVADARVAGKRAAVKAAEAQMQIARAKLDVLKAKTMSFQASEIAAKAKLQNVKSLFEKKVVSAVEVALETAVYQKTTAQLREAQAQIAVGEAELSRDSALREQALAALAESLAQVKQARPGANVPKVAGKSAEINALLKERRDTLHKALDITVNLTQKGKSTLADLVQAQRDAFRSTLDLPDTAEKRIAELESLEKKAESIVKLAEARFNAARGTQLDTLQAHAVLLEIRIALLRERAKVKASK